MKNFTDSIELGWPILHEEILVGRLYLFGVFTGRTFYWIESLLHLQGLLGLGIPFLLKVLKHI